jgi:nucleoside phosphorylase
MGMIATAILATKLIQFARPRFLVMAGICAGVEGRVGIGDVVLADPCWDYQSGKYVVDGKVGSRFDIAPHQIAISDAIRVRVDAMRRDRNVWRDIEDRWVVPKPSNGLRLHIGPVASGSAVIADAAQVELVKAQQRQLLGIEMEIYGLLAAAHSANCPKPTAFALKSVCDFADSNKNDNHHAYAAYTSAQSIRAFFERYMHEIQGFAGT